MAYILLALIAAVAIKVGIGVWRFAHLSNQGKRHYLIMCWHRMRFRWLARACGLAYIDQHKRSASVFHFGTKTRVKKGSQGNTELLRHPKGKWRADNYGWYLVARTVPKVGRKEFEAASDYIAAQWKCQRIAISVPKPGKVKVRALRQDPLLVPFTVADVPQQVYSGTDLTTAYVGKDESGTHRYMTVKDNTAATIAGMPGSGKSVGVNNLLMQWAPNPAAQFGTADGKSPFTGGDYEVWRDRAWRTCSDSREDVADMLSDAVKIMKERLGCVAQVTGSVNAWHNGPQITFPFFGLILDEAQRYLDATFARQQKDKQLEALIGQITAMAQDIVRQGRSVLCFLVIATQRATVDSIPGQIRDNAALSLALAQKTTDACVAALGSQIRDYPSYLPTQLQGPEYQGCAIASMRTGEDPYTRLRLPLVTHAELQDMCRKTAHLKRDPSVSPLVVV